MPEPKYRKPIGKAKPTNTANVPVRGPSVARSVKLGAKGTKVPPKPSNAAQGNVGALNSATQQRGKQPANLAVKAKLVRGTGNLSNSMVDAKTGVVKIICISCNDTGKASNGSYCYPCLVGGRIAGLKGLSKDERAKLK